MLNIFIENHYHHSHVIIFTGGNESEMDFTENLTMSKLRKSQFNLSVSLTPGELSAIFDTTAAQPKLNCKIYNCYSFLQKCMLQSIFNNKYYVFY